jgi:hypothetical protein
MQRLAPPVVPALALSLDRALLVVVAVVVVVKCWLRV